MLNQSTVSKKISVGFVTWFSIRRKKTFVAFEYDIIKRQLSYRNTRSFSRLHRIEAWNDIMKVTRLETLFINVNRKFKKVGVKFILFQMISLCWKLNQSRGPTGLHCPHIKLELFFNKLTTNLGLMILFGPCNNVDVDHRYSFISKT